MFKKLSLFLLTGALLSTQIASALQETASAPVAASGIVQVEDAVYAVDSYRNAVVSVTDGGVEIVAGQQDVTDLSGRPIGGYNDGSFSQAAFSQPWDIVPYLDGLLVSDSGNHVLRYLDLEKELVYTLAGAGEAGYLNASQAGKARFDSPTGLAVDENGTVYVADTGNNVIRAIDQYGAVTTFAGGSEGCALGATSEALFSQPTGLCYADGVLYVADSGNHRIVAISGGQVTLVAGETPEDSVAGGYLNGRADQALFSNPQGIAVGEDGAIYVADTGNGAIRLIRDGQVTTLLRLDGDSTFPVSPRGLLLSGNTLYVGDVFSQIMVQYNLGGQDVDNPDGQGQDVAEGTQDALLS